MRLAIIGASGMLGHHAAVAAVNAQLKTMEAATSDGKHRDAHTPLRSMSAIRARMS